MGELIKRITTAVKNLFTGWVSPDIKEALSTSTPVSREEIQDQVVKFLELAQKPVKSKLLELEEAASPVTPEESAAWATAFASAGAAAWGLGAGGSVLAEALSLGQIETISRWLESVWMRIGLATMIATPIWTLYDAGVRRPFRYFALGKFQPMIPSISDQIRFAVREAYPGVRVEKMGEEMKKWIRYLGYSDFWADAFWNAHWLIPTLEQARELWRRGVITEKEYIDFLRLSDYAPKYNDLWLQLAWELPGRIDQRWMFEWGIIDRSKLVEFVRARGIHPEWQEAVADAYVKHILRDEIGRVRSQLVALFREGFIDASTLRTELAVLGYRTEVIDMTIREAELRREYDEKTELLKFYMDQLTKAKIDEEEFVSKCRELGLTEEAIERKMSMALLKRKKK